MSGKSVCQWPSAGRKSPGSCCRCQILGTQRGQHSHRPPRFEAEPLKQSEDHRAFPASTLENSSSSTSRLTVVPPLLSYRMRGFTLLIAADQGWRTEVNPTLDPTVAQSRCREPRQGQLSVGANAASGTAEIQAIKGSRRTSSTNISRKSRNSASANRPLRCPTRQFRARRTVSAPPGLPNAAIRRPISASHQAAAAQRHTFW